VTGRRQGGVAADVHRPLQRRRVDHRAVAGLLRGTARSAAASLSREDYGGRGARTAVVSAAAGR
jgi:hypothetical protein